jgi:hypothetical protein
MVIDSTKISTTRRKRMKERVVNVMAIIPRGLGHDGMSLPLLSPSSLASKGESSASRKTAGNSEAISRGHRRCRIQLFLDFERHFVPTS